MLILPSNDEPSDEPKMNRDSDPGEETRAPERETPDASRLLAETEPFDGLPAESREMLAARAEWRRLARGTTIYEEGDRASMLALLLEGGVVLVREPLGHPVVRLARLGPGDVVGGGEVWTAERRSATARTVEDSTILCLMREDLAELERRAPDAALRLQLAAARQSSTSVEGVLGEKEDRVRYRLELEVRREDASGSHRLWLVDISPGGVRLEGIPEDWTPGHRVDFRLRTPVGSLPVLGRIAWREGSQGGIALHDPWESAEEESMIHSLLATVRTSATLRSGD